MNIKGKTAFTLYILASLMLIVFGLIYLLSPEFMPYHAKAIGRNWNELEKPLQIFIRGFFNPIR